MAGKKRDDLSHPMGRPKSFRNIIECWECLAASIGKRHQGIRLLAEEIGKNPRSVRKWKSRNRIASDDWHKVARASLSRAESIEDKNLREAFFGITVELMAELAEVGETCESLTQVGSSETPASQLESRVNMAGSDKKYETLTQLGGKGDIAASPEAATLETVPNPNPGTDYLVRFTAPEFTALCPVTGQPDFAHLVIDYVPAERLIESKSLKLYLAAFRNHGGFHEDCTLAVARKVVEAAKPKWLRIGGYWYPRGGIPIDVFWQTGEPPAGLWLPDQGVAPYRGRG